MYASLLFDVEDYTTPPEHGMDDIPKWMAEIMTEERVVGTFLVMGGKARSLRDRGRKDAIRAMARHEIGSHTDNGSEHPTLTEYLAEMDWDKGVAHCREKEMRHAREMETIFGVKLGCFSRHGGNFAPQHTYVAGEAGLPILYAHTGMPPHTIAWYCGALNFSGWISIGEKTYADPREVDKVLARWDGEIARAAEAGSEWLGVFLAHPLMVKCKQFNDALNFSDGRTRRPYLIPEFVPEKQVRGAKEGFRKVCRYIREQKKFENLPVGETAKVYSGTVPALGRKELAGFAGRVREKQTILSCEPVSPAEQALAFARAIAKPSAKSLPARTKVDRILGPMDEPRVSPDCSWLSWGEVQALAREFVRFAEAKGGVPGNLPVPGSCPGSVIGLSTLYFLFADGVCALAAGKPGRLRARHVGPRYPYIAMEIESRARQGYMGWPIFDPYMNTEKLCRYTRLQSWTIKTAVKGGFRT